MKRKLILNVILIVIILGGGGTGYYFWYQSANYLSTEDARITGDVYRVMPRISGKITSLNVKIGDVVLADQILGQQDVTNLANNMLDQAVLRAPISGTVIQTSARVGEVASPGQSIAMIVNKKSLYVSAEIEESDIRKVRIGQPVSFTVDTYEGAQFTGKVKEIGQATASTFSLLPVNSTNSNFTKVTQRINIKIAIDDQQGFDLSPGMNTVVKIHIKGE